MGGGGEEEEWSLPSSRFSSPSFRFSSSEGKGVVVLKFAQADDEFENALNFELESVKNGEKESFEFVYRSFVCF